MSVSAATERKSSATRRRIVLLSVAMWMAIGPYLIGLERWGDVSANHAGFHLSVGLSFFALAFMQWRRTSTLLLVLTAAAAIFAAVAPSLGPFIGVSSYLDLSPQPLALHILPGVIVLNQVLSDL